MSTAKSGPSFLRRLGIDPAIAQWIGNRDEQQDAAHIVSAANGVLAMVADGMGGMDGGRLAAHAALASFRDHFLGGRDVAKTREKQFQSAFTKAEVDVRRALLGMDGGCALTVAYVRRGPEAAVWFSHAGDVAGFLYRPIGKDRVEERVRLEAHRINRHMLANALTCRVPDVVAETTCGHPLEVGDVIVLASDGVADEIGGTSLARAVAAGGSASTMTKRILDLVKKKPNPKHDNATVLVLRIGERFLQS